MSIYRIVSAEKARTPISVVCELLGVSRSGYYDWATRAPSDRELSDAWLLERVKEIHQANRRVYGSPPLKKELVHRQSWPTRRELTSEVFEYIEAFYNPVRRHSTLGMLSPVQFEEQSLSINNKN